MKRIALLAGLLSAVTFWTACNREQTPQTQQAPVVTQNGTTIPPDDQYWAKNNFDLQRVGEIVRRSHSPEEFERYLNRPGGIDNLDLNGDGYVDYISVREFDDINDPYCRGLSMYTQYGPDQIQELGTVMFYRDQPQYPGARILLRGDPRIYGDNAYYETNWLDQTLQLVSYLFNGNRDIYSTPYYYDNYPNWYETYNVVETPVYQQRVVELYPQPALVYTTQPQIIDKIKIKSPNDGRDYTQVHAFLVKPTREQENFIKENPRPEHMARAEKNAKPDQGDRGRHEGERPGPADGQPAAQGPVARHEARQPKSETAPNVERPKIARNENPKANRPMSAGTPGRAAKPAPVPAAKPSKAPGNPGGGNGKHSGGNPGGNGHGKQNGGGKPVGKPGGGGGKKH